MSKYTPGPWVVGSSVISGVACVDAVDPKDGQLFELCEVFGEDSYREITEMSSANARLIAAAPDLLEALEGLLAVVEQNDLPLSDQERIAARAAIAKARGN